MNNRAQVLAWRRRVASKPEPHRLYRCSGGPFDGQQIALTSSGCAATFVFRVGEQVGYYTGSGTTVFWKEVA